jgi:hypothetical protein
MDCPFISCKVPGAGYLHMGDSNGGWGMMQARSRMAAKAKQGYQLYQGEELAERIEELMVFE